MSNELVKTEEVKLTNSERFTKKVLAEFKGNVGQIELNNYQRELINGYFIGIDRALIKAEEDRVVKNNYLDKKNELAYAWDNVDLNDISLGAVHHAKMGLDVMLDNHLNPIPYKNKKGTKYNIAWIKGYKGLEYIAMEHALVVPKNITIELVHENDEFEVIKKSVTNKYDTYKLTIKNPFSRGKCIGGFGYIEYVEENNNRLILMSETEILKRKPIYAAPEFWGGEKDKWENKKKIGKETIEGWKDQMYLKTVARAVYNKISPDPKKINGSYAYVVSNDTDYAEAQVINEIDNNANKLSIDIEDDTNAQYIPYEQEQPQNEEIDTKKITNEESVKQNGALPRREF